jgi:hypothetical protein
MNSKVANQIAEMKKQTIGVEVEMNSISRSKAAQIAADFFGTGRYSNAASTTTAAIMPMSRAFLPDFFSIPKPLSAP